MPRIRIKLEGQAIKASLSSVLGLITAGDAAVDPALTATLETPTETPAQDGKLVIRRRKPVKPREDEKNWKEVTDQVERRKLQNRLNQRAKRHRNLAEPLPIGLPPKLAPSRFSAQQSRSSSKSSANADGLTHFILDSDRARPLPVGAVVKNTISGKRVFPWASSRLLDPVKVLSPHLDDPMLRNIWQESEYTNRLLRRS